MKQYFEEQKGHTGQPPRHAVLSPDRGDPKALPAAKARTKAEADSIVLELRRGADFAIAARPLFPGPRLEGTGWLAELVSPGCDGAGVREGGFHAQARHDLRPGGIAFRLPHHSGRAGTAGRGSGSPHPADSPIDSAT